MPDFTALLNNFPSFFPFTLQSITVYGGFLVLIIGVVFLVVGLKRELKRPDPLPGSVLRERYGQTGIPGRKASRPP
jgi:hypothetical protein